MPHDDAPRDSFLTGVLNALTNLLPIQDRLTTDGADPVVEALRWSPALDELGFAAASSAADERALRRDVIPGDRALETEVSAAQATLSGRRMRAYVWQLYRPITPLSQVSGPLTQLMVRVDCEWPAGFALLQPTSTSPMTPESSHSLPTNRARDQHRVPSRGPRGSATWIDRRCPRRRVGG